jgi:hypothetical protein
MATSGEMVLKMAQMWGINPATIESIDRVLSDAGLRSKSGRGRGAAHMTGLDISNLALAVVHGVGMKEAPTLVARVSGLARHLVRVKRTTSSPSVLDQLSEGTDWSFPMGGDELSALPLADELRRAETLGSAMAVLIDGFVAGAFNDVEALQIKVLITNRKPPARITFEGNARKVEITYGAEIPADTPPPHGVELTLDESLLMKLADIIRRA